MKVNDHFPKGHKNKLFHCKLLFLLNNKYNDMIMTKRVKIIAENIKKTKDRKFIFKTYEDILESIFDFSAVATKLFFDKTDDSFVIDFNVKVSKAGDMLLVLCKEYMSLLTQTEESIEVSISELEQDGTGVLYKFYKYNGK